MVWLLKAIHEMCLSPEEISTLFQSTHAMARAKWPKSSANWNKSNKTSSKVKYRVNDKNHLENLYRKKLGQLKASKQKPSGIQNKCAGLCSVHWKSAKSDRNQYNKQMTVASNSFWPLPQSFIKHENVRWPKPHCWPLQASIRYITTWLLAFVRSVGRSVAFTVFYAVSHCDYDLIYYRREIVLAPQFVFAFWRIDFIWLSFILNQFDYTHVGVLPIIQSKGFIYFGK